MGSRRTNRTSKRSRGPEARSTGRSSQLLRAVSRHLKATRRDLSERQRVALARKFLAAGTAAIHTLHGSLEESAAAMGYHRRMLGASRLRVAQWSRLRGVAIHQSSEFDRIHDTLVYHWRRLREYPNVVGFGAGFRFTDGVRTDERCASILVSKKVCEQKLSRGKREVLPKTLRRAGHATPVDVFEVGDFKLYTGPSGRIAPQSSPSRSATLGIFASDNDSPATLALTAMHAAGDMQDYPPDGGGGETIAFLAEDGDEQTLLGELLRGTRRHGIDAAAIKLADRQQPSRLLPGVGEVQNWRVLNKDADTGISVTMCGAESGSPVHGVISNPCVYVPQHNLGPAIQVSIAAQPGDSGAPLVDRDTFLLGLLVGGGETTQFFSPIGNIFNELSCDLY